VQLGSREPAKFDEDKFREEARQFQKEKEMEEYQQRNKKPVKAAEDVNTRNALVVDERILANDQTGDVYKALQ
jgi:hypothetical protein